MPAKSKKQQRYFGMVHAVQQGDIAAPSKAIAETAQEISPSDATDFASTKHKGLPEKKKEKKGVTMTPMQMLAKLAAKQVPDFVPGSMSGHGKGKGVPGGGRRNKRKEPCPEDGPGFGEGGGRGKGRNRSITKGAFDMTSNQAIIKLAAYIRYLVKKADARSAEKQGTWVIRNGKRIHTECKTKEAHPCRFAKLAEALETHQDIFRAVQEVYKDKSAAYHYKVIQGLVRGFRQKLAAAQKRAMLGSTVHPSASIGAPGIGMPNPTQALSAPSGSRTISLGAGAAATPAPSARV